MKQPYTVQSFQLFKHASKHIGVCIHPLTLSMFPEIHDIFITMALYHTTIYFIHWVIIVVMGCSLTPTLHSSRTISPFPYRPL